MTRVTAALATAAILLTGGALTACGSSGSGSSGSPALILYNGQHEQTANNLIAAFEKQTGITVKVRSPTTRTLLPIRSPPRAASRPPTCSSPRTARRSRTFRPRGCCRQ